MLKLTFFGQFSVTAQDITLSEEENRAPRVWRAFMYLLAHRNQRVSLRDFSAYLREGKTYTAAPSYGAGNDSLVKTTLYRIRELLAPLQKAEPACRLICRDGGIWFDPELTFSADTDRFDAIARELTDLYDGTSSGEKKPDRALLLFRSLVTLYGGKYLPALANESWVLPEASRYHETYVDLCEKHLPLLFDRKLFDEIIDITSRGTAIDPYCECFRYWKIRALAAKGEYALALSLYDSVKKLFHTSFRINPSARLRQLKETLCVVPPAADTADAANALHSLLAPSSVTDRPSAALSSPDDLSVFLRFVLTGKNEKELRFALLTVSENAPFASISAALEAILSSNGVFTRYSLTQYAIVFSEETYTAQAIKKYLEENRIEFTWEQIPCQG